MIKESILNALDNFLSDKQSFYNDNHRPRVISNYTSYKSIVIEIPRLLKLKASLLSKHYSVTGSISSGNITEVPWIGIFDNDITRSATKGYYIVYLFTADMKGVYLSLNQGWTQYEQQFKTSEGRKRIKQNAEKAQDLLRGLDGFEFNRIELGARNSLVTGYENGNICSKYYSKDSLPSDEELVDDLRNLIGVYRELKNLVGTDILRISDVISEEQFQNQIQVAETTNIPLGPIDVKGRTINSKDRASWIRDTAMAAQALKEANYCCEVSQEHRTFVSSASGNEFVEAHHLIPMEYQKSFQVSIDVPENIIALCPNCHRAFHHSTLAHKNKLIEDFYWQRKDRLEARAIYLSLSQLVSFYNNDYEYDSFDMGFA